MSQGVVKFKLLDFKILSHDNYCMSVVVKDQEMLKIENLVKNKSYTEVNEIFFTKNYPRTIKSFNNAYLEYEKGNLVEARMYLEKAKFNGMFSQDVESALDQVKAELGLVYSEQEQTSFDNFILNFKSFSDQFSLSIGLIFFIITVILFLKRAKWIAIVPFVISCFIFGVIYNTKNLDISFNKSENVVYSGPSRIFEEVQILPKGAKVIFTKESSDWKFIKYPSMYSGWVYKNKAIKL